MKNILLILVLSVFSLSYAQNKNTKKNGKTSVYSTRIWRHTL